MTQHQTLLPCGIGDLGVVMVGHLDRAMEINERFSVSTGGLGIATMVGMAIRRISQTVEIGLVYSPTRPQKVAAFTAPPGEQVGRLRYVSS